MASPRSSVWVWATLVLLGGCIEPIPPEEPVAPGGEAPAWRVGDWWTYRFSSDVYDLTFEATLIVGAVTDDGYRVGMAPDDYSLDAILFHVPPVGFLGRNLSYNVHDVLFDPVQFPLAEGESWVTQWIAAPVHFAAHAREVSTPSGREPGFHVSNAGYEALANRSYEYEYAPSAGWFSMYQRVDLDGRVRERIDLVEHGRDRTGPVRLLDGITMVYLQGRSATTATQVTGAFTTPLRLDTIFAACVFGDAPGHYSIEIQSPTRAACSSSGTVPPNDPVRRIVSAEVPNESGLWEVRFVALGTGTSLAEVMGYHSWTVDV